MIHTNDNEYIFNCLFELNYDSLKTKNLLSNAFELLG